MKRSSTVGVALCWAVVVASVAAAQTPARQAPGKPPDDKVGVAIALKAGGDSYSFTGKASCTHEQKGYIYMVPAALWRVEQRDANGNMMLTFWRPATGSGDMFSLIVQRGRATHHADTVKTKDGGAPQGSGEVKFAPAGGGGTFTVDATTASGVKITGTIKCDAFRPASAEGGN